MSDGLIRRATLDDVPRLVALVHSAYRGEASKAGWTTEADLLDGQRTDQADVAAAISTPQQCILVLEKAAELLASVHVKKLEDACYLGMFAVKPGAQGGGIGRRMVHAAEALALSEFGVAQMRMYVISLRDSLIAWYERLGYRRTGETAPFPYGDPRFGLPKRDDLQFVVLARDLVSATAER
jgi:ribosomal protein S18 acetylase RimI-like enzyme